MAHPPQAVAHDPRRVIQVHHAVVRAVGRVVGDAERFQVAQDLVPLVVLVERLERTLRR